MGGSNRAFEPGNLQVSAPYFVAGRSGILTGLTAGNPVARLAQLGAILSPASPPVVSPTPIQISQIRLKYLPATSPAAGVAFEILKGTGTPATTGGNAHAPQRRKTTGYPAIATTETHLYVSDTGAISGGTFTALDAGGPLDWVAVGLADVSAGSAIWTPSDLCPLQLEAGEALEARIVSNISGTGILLVAFDFLR